MGGESGPGARPMHPDWVRSVRDQCQEANVAFNFKQWGNFKPGKLVKREEIDKSRSLSTYEFDDAAPLFRFGYVHNWGNGIISAETTKKAAGRTLDGEIYDAYPE